MNTNYSFENSVFINCPFDDPYKVIFRACAYTVLACGFNPVSALQGRDGSLSRLHKIQQLIRSCKYSIHDISMDRLDKNSRLPRFNMPLELGIDYGCKFYGNEKDQEKVFLIFESRTHKSQKYLSDLAGEDKVCHEMQPKKVITEVRNWLYTESNPLNQFILPGDQEIIESFEEFCTNLPKTCNIAKVEMDSISYVNLLHFMSSWMLSKPQLIGTRTSNS